MAKKTSNVVFCDIGDILGVPVFSPPPPHLESLDVFPFVRDVLSKLRDDGNRLGIISNTGDEKPEDIDNVLEKGGCWSSLTRIC
jgi:bacterial leucyl aminopeptidase